MTKLTFATAGRESPTANSFASAEAGCYFSGTKGNQKNVLFYVSQRISALRCRVSFATAVAGVTFRERKVTKRYLVFVSQRISALRVGNARQQISQVFFHKQLLYVPVNYFCFCHCGGRCYFSGTKSNQKNI